MARFGENDRGQIDLAMHFSTDRILNPTPKTAVQHGSTRDTGLLPNWTRIRRNVSDFAAYLVVRLFVAIIQTLPLDMGDRCCRALASLIVSRFKIRRRITQGNLKQVFPDATPRQLEKMEFAMWHHLLLMVCEIAWAQRRLHLTNWPQYVQFRDNRAVLKNCLSKRPSVTVTGHFGNFEIGGYTMGLMGCESTTIARRLDNPYLDAWVHRFRSAKGQRMLDKEGCATEVDQHLAAGGSLVILADQHAGPKGCWTNFLGIPASCHKALALFSLGSKATMLVGYTRRVGGTPMQFESGSLGVADPVNDPEGICESVKTLTKWYNRTLARAVDLSVEQYWWLHRRWREPPPKVAQRLAKESQRLAKESQRLAKESAGQVEMVEAEHEAA